jgi:hypothetical protein
MGVGLLWIVRFACQLPMSMVGFDGLGLYNAVKDLDAVGIYDVIPGGRIFLLGLQTSATWVSPEKSRWELRDPLTDKHRE